MTDIVRISPGVMKNVARQLDVTGSSVTKAARIAAPCELFALPYVEDSLANIKQVARSIGANAEAMSTDIDMFLVEAEAMDGFISDRFIDKGWQQ
ncbi:hypothetical protein [Nocardioides sp. InS609-2]|uniref:hypothetical protein n=1 Tax=Nocardioides sp. InS609-2 TaxID=2760705 RepID=UPI0020BD6C85|nr:hypothetical protein [Nocardioides sp. InS609-2]